MKFRERAMYELFNLRVLMNGGGDEWTNAGVGVSK